MLRRALPPGLGRPRGAQASAADKVTLDSMRKRVDAMRRDADVPAGQRLSQELSFIHLLSMLPEPEYLKECIVLGGRVWEDVTQAEAATHRRDPHNIFYNHSLQLCASMRRASQKLGDKAQEAHWEKLFTSRQDSMFHQSKLAAKVEIDERGVKVKRPIGPGAGANALWNSLRHPAFDLARGTALFIPDDDWGPRVGTHKNITRGSGLFA